MKRLAVLSVFAAVALGVAWAADDSDPRKPLSETPLTWQFDFEPLGSLKPLFVRLPGEKTARTFWYLRYRITNRTGEDRAYVPSFDLCTNTGQLFSDRSFVPKGIFDEIQALYNDPLLKDIPGMTGKLLEGEDNAKDGVAIWPDFDPKAGQVEIYVGGLSGDQRILKLPREVEVTRKMPDGKVATIRTEQVVLDRTLVLLYDVPGEAAARHTTPTRLVKDTWIMR